MWATTNFYVTCMFTTRFIYIKKLYPFERVDFNLNNEEEKVN